MHNKTLKTFVRDGFRYIEDAQGCEVARFQNPDILSSPGYFGYACFIQGLTGYKEASLFDTDRNQLLFGPVEELMKAHW